MKKICIICRKPKENFTLEHVLPAAIGGAFVINTVCEDCNSQLGKTIDADFLSNDIVLYYRKTFNIKRKSKLGDRRIRNPFKKKGYFYDDEGNKHFVSFNEEKKEFETTIVPIYEEPVNDGDKIIGQLTIPLKNFKSEDDLIKKYAKKYDLDIKEYKIVKIEKDINPNRKIRVFLSFSNNTVILEYLKIAYELAITFFPNYIDDNQSKEYSQILQTSKITEKQNIFFDSNSLISDDLDKAINKYNYLKPYHHIVLFKTIKGKGLICTIKIFNFTYTILLSKNEDYIVNNEILVVNDAIRHVYWLDLPIRLKEYNLTLDIESLNINISSKLMLIKEEGFKTKSGSLPVFDKRGIEKYKDINELEAISPLQSFPKYFKKEPFVNKVKYNKDLFYVNFFEEDLLIPIEEIRYVYEFLF